ncbi:anti-anti-sigma factor [Bacillus mesophilus]|uniref:Anti-sigma factor antagonist n=1 Tax=Bacillus mesophilus TaxID=1808955 RepID=A0A6M0Q3P7_9BACI|nr:STAS domain-containing protein [Bacillus mesophilus]MBM7659971.1 anti-anti-sigma factor [Bacillus mesophilus]NEY70832.1 STAS domain-containing protein [Bacillus mesophilus]
MSKENVMFEHKTMDERQIFKISGKLQYGSTQNIKESLLHHVDNEIKHFVFDLTNITYIDSTGMGLFVTFMKHLNNPKNHIVLVIEDTFITELFKIAKLDTIFKLSNSLEDAINKQTIANHK